MKKIEFGYANEQNPKGSWQGTGIKPGLLLTEADYYGAIKYEDNSYIVAKVVKDEYGHYPDLVDKFIVRPAIADMYVDGSGIIFLDQEQSLEGQQIENYLNDVLVKDKISNVNDIVSLCNGIHIADRSFTFLTLNDTVITTSILHEVFESRNTALKNCRQSFSELQSYYQLNNTSSLKN